MVKKLKTTTVIHIYFINSRLTTSSLSLWTYLLNSYSIFPSQFSVRIKVQWKQFPSEEDLVGRQDKNIDLAQSVVTIFMPFIVPSIWTETGFLSNSRKLSDLDKRKCRKPGAIDKYLCHFISPFSWSQPHRHHRRANPHRPHLQSSIVFQQEHVTRNKSFCNWISVIQPT